MNNFLITRFISHFIIAINVTLNESWSIGWSVPLSLDPSSSSLYLSLIWTHYRPSYGLGGVNGMRRGKRRANMHLPLLLSALSTIHSTSGWDGTVTLISSLPLSLYPSYIPPPFFSSSFSPVNFCFYFLADSAIFDRRLPALSALQSMRQAKARLTPLESGIQL